MTHEVRVERVWENIVAWCKQYAPATAAVLRPPAGADAIEAAERATGVAWPAELKKWYSLHDGVDWQETDGEFLFGYMPASLEILVSNYRLWRDVWAEIDVGGPSLAELMAKPAGTGAGTYLPCYLPFAMDVCGTCLVLDARGGALAGPIREFDKVEADSFASDPIWPSLTELLEELANSLEHGSAGRRGLSAPTIVLAWKSTQVP